MSGERAQDETERALRSAVGTEALDIVESLLAADVVWYGDSAGGACRSRGDVVGVLREQAARVVRPHLRTVRRFGDRVLIEVGLAGADETAPAIWFTLTLDDAGQIAQLQDYADEPAAHHDLKLRAARAAGETPPAPAVVSGLVPFVHVSNMRRSLAFYELLGFTIGDSFAPDGEPVWAALESVSAALMLALAEEPIDAGAQGVLFYLYARDLEGLRDHLVFHGLTPGVIVDGTPGPKQEMRLTDPDGYVLMVAQIDAATVVGA